MIVDAHQHFWQVGRFDYPWMTSDLGILYRDYVPSQLEPVLRENDVSQTVLVQASNSVAETQWLLDLADENDFVAGVVGWVDLTNADFELCVHPKFKGVRHLVESEPDDDWLARPAVITGLQRLAAHGLTYDLLVHTRHLRHVKKVAENCPELSLVIDHLAKPPIAKHGFDEWSREIKPLASYPNMYCKLSGLVTEANWNSWQTDDLRPYVDHVLDLFGPERLIFGSDHPVCLLAASYDGVLASFNELLKDVSTGDRELIFSKNARTVYRLNDA